MTQAEKKLPDGLEEAANKFAVFYDQGTCDGIAQDCFIAGAEWQKGNIKNLLKSWAENELDEHPNKNDDFRLAIYSLIDKLDEL